MTEEYHAELKALRSMFKVAAAVVASMSSLAIIGWVTIAVNDHYGLRSVTQEVNEMKPRVTTLWYMHNQPTLTNNNKQ